MSRLLGDGYEPHVDAESGALAYSLPVDSGFVSASFSFAIRQQDVDVLLADPYRRAALEVIARTVLQRSMLPGTAKFTQPMFDALVMAVLHGTRSQLEADITRLSREHNNSIRIYIRQILASRGIADQA